ncbi:MAG: hypothetical protein ACI35Q_02170 [Marinilabiliaceae bacterium]
MKNSFIITLIAFALASCSKIPDTPVWNEISTDELASAIKEEPGFAETYEAMRALHPEKTLSDTQKAKYKDMTWRRYYKMVKYAKDSTIFNPLKEQWTEEWNQTLSKDLGKVDSLMGYWLDFKKENSLERLVTAKVIGIKKTYYSYINTIKGVYFVFGFTPLVDGVEQFRFNYSYDYKINSGRGRGEKHNCIYSQPLKGEDTGWYEADYFEREKLEDETFESFMQSHDFQIEITDVRVNGKNYSLEELNIPKAVTNLWDSDTEENRDEVAKLINPEYESLQSYLAARKQETIERKDPLYAEFTKEFIGSAAAKFLEGLHNIFK